MADTDRTPSGTTDDDFWTSQEPPEGMTASLSLAVRSIKAGAATLFVALSVLWAHHGRVAPLNVLSNLLFVGRHVIHASMTSGLNLSP